MKELILVILGPTAAGKNEFASKLADALPIEIIGMDSTTVYKHFNIGTNKPGTEERKKVPHHLYDTMEPESPSSAYHFVEEANPLLSAISTKNHIPCLVGGTYFYLRALEHGMYEGTFIANETLEEIETEFSEEDGSSSNRMHEYLKTVDPTACQQIHPNDRYRLVRAIAIFRTSGIQTSSLRPAKNPSKNRLFLKYALLRSRHVLSDEIVKRTETMLANGLLSETALLLERYPRARALQAIGYAEAVKHIKGELTEKQLRNEIIEKTRQLAKRQMTWLRSDPDIRFVDHRDVDRVVLEVKNLKHCLGGTL